MPVTLQDAACANIREIGSHSKLAWIDGMKSARRSDADFEAAVQLAGRVINVGPAPCDDDATFDSDVLQLVRLESTKRRYELRHGLQRSLHQIRAQWLPRLNGTLG